MDRLRSRRVVIQNHDFPAGDSHSLANGRHQVLRPFGWQGGEQRGFGDTRGRFRIHWELTIEHLPISIGKCQWFQVEKDNFGQ